ncbi:phosphotransferase [Nanohaloarchaea archaeon H01]|nr:phosphotransferase [Nanohaloarchaea archaeon H01]
MIFTVGNVSLKGDVQNAVSQFDPEKEIVDIENISGHNNKIFRVKLRDSTIVCKFYTGEKGGQDCRKEVNMHHLLEKEIDVKTPEILYSDPEADKTKLPFFISEYIDGSGFQDSFVELEAQKQVEVVEQSGQILGEVHSQVSFKYAGELISEEGNITVDRELGWVEYITEELSQAVDEAEETRFSDLGKKAEDIVDRFSELAEPEKKLVFYDFRPDNVIAKDGEIEALIDFERAWSGDPLWDYAYSEMSFVEPHHYYEMQEPPKADEEKLREAFQGGYEEKIKLGENWRKKVELYKLGIMIKRFNTFKGWTESTEMTEGKIRRQEKLLRSSFDRLYQSLNMHSIGLSGI